MSRRGATRLSHSVPVPRRSHCGSLVAHAGHLHNGMSSVPAGQLEILFADEIMYRPMKSWKP